MSITIRLIKPTDNTAVRQLILDVLAEFGCVGPGFASNDPELANLYGAYQQQGRFWVLVDETNTVVGCGGYSRLKGTENDQQICEMQKLYFLPHARGGGMGRQLVNLITNDATKAGYRYMYIETVPQMTQAVSFYNKLGFQMLSSPLGNTGHCGCSIHMMKALSSLNVASA